jgi:hypothetical protein
MAELLGEVKEVRAEFDGRVIKGWYFVSGRVVKVRSSTGHLKSAQLGGLARYPEGLARLLLLELAKQGNA